MNWLDMKIWKQCLVSTFICLIGCSIGGFGTTFYLAEYNLFFVLLVSISAGLISCMAFMMVWQMMFSRMNFKDSFRSSYKMSVVSILIMIITENSIILFIAPEFLSFQMHMNATHGFKIMLLAMSLGFILSLPYNYYQLQKTGEKCHF